MMMPRRPFTASLLVLVSVIVACAAFHVAVPLKTRSVQKPLYMFFEENGDKASTKTQVEGEPVAAVTTEMEAYSEIEAPKFEVEASEKGSVPAVNSLDFS